MLAYGDQTSRSGNGRHICLMTELSVMGESEAPHMQTEHENGAMYPQLWKGEGEEKIK